MVHEVGYDMKGYLKKAEAIAKKKLDMYSSLVANIQMFNQKFGNSYWINRQVERDSDWRGVRDKYILIIILTKLVSYLNLYSWL